MVNYYLKFYFIMRIWKMYHLVQNRDCIHWCRPSLFLTSTCYSLRQKLITAVTPSVLNQIVVWCILFSHRCFGWDRGLNCVVSWECFYMYPHFPFPFKFKGWLWHLIIFVPVHCHFTLVFYSPSVYYMSTETSPLFAHFPYGLVDVIWTS